MRVVIQRVSSASVEINQQTHSSIQKGLVILAGFEESDTLADLDWMAGKIVSLRIFSDNEGKMNRSIQEVNGELLLVSQFTLYASTMKGNRPSYIRVARPETAIPLYEQFIEVLNNLGGKPIKTGVFGADMQVQLINDGPVTIVIDTKNKE